MDLAAKAFVEDEQMNWLLAPPSKMDVVRLLKAWRFWVLLTLLGAVLGAGWYRIAPPPFRARATVNVDFNLELAWPAETDRQQFYYLEREVRKLEEIAWSDDVIREVSEKSGMQLPALRNGVLSLSQPAEAGWHFYADDRDPDRAALLASAWAEAFAQQVRLEVTAQTGLSSFIRVEATQLDGIPVARSVSESAYLLSGALACLFLGAGGLLLVTPVKEP